MAELLKVALVAVDRRVWTGEATMLSATTVEGDLGILPGHAPLLGQLVDGTAVRISTENGDELSYRVEGGYLSVTDQGVSVLVERVTETSEAAAQ